jgi:alginate O-acetyltransferase complex protein AlgI
MIFSSVTFLLYFLPIFICLYIIADKKYKNIVILLGSIIFYAWGAPKFIFIILGTTILDFVFVKIMYNSNTKTKKNMMLLLSLFMNVGLLFYFKYFNFFIDNLNPILKSVGNHPIEIIKIILPIGISFYTFESITYVVDVYRGIHKPLKNFWDYQLYIIFFPKLIAGPIVRYHDIAPQIYGRLNLPQTDNILIGLNRVVLGLSKKVLIANVVGQQANLIFEQENYNSLTTPIAWLGALCYTIQIYFDFSGYSDMAIGLAKMMGFQLPENFDKPYTSTSITEFWRRWHISLGSWMRNYLYIPLGGNKNGIIKTYFNLWIVFLLSGLWHGASFNFLLWGAYHGFWLVLERLIPNKLTNAIPNILKNLKTFIIVLLGWVLFRIDTLQNAIEYYKRMFSFHDFKLIEVKNSLWFALIIGLFFSLIGKWSYIEALSKNWYGISVLSNKKATCLFFISAVLFILCISRILGSSFNPFIYFRF